MIFPKNSAKEEDDDREKDDPTRLKHSSGHLWDDHINLKLVVVRGGRKTYLSTFAFVGSRASFSIRNLFFVKKAAIKCSLKL